MRKRKKEVKKANMAIESTDFTISAYDFLEILKTIKY